MVALVVSLLLSLVQGVLLFCLGYQVFLALVSVRRPQAPRAPSAPRTRFALAIPAHNEGMVLSATLAQLGQQDYPAELFDVHVVADHCTDHTAEVAQQGGASAHIRDSLPRGRKAYALQWLLDRLVGEERGYDAVAIFDADSLVAPDFLRIMDRYLRAGREVLQGQHIVSNPEDSRLAAVAAVDMRLNNRLRNQSRRNLGFACRLMGDGMVFGVEVLRRYGWLGETLIEDREQGYELLLRGIRATYVPEARSFGQAASSWRRAQPQRLRWYRGVVDMQRRLAGRLLAGALRARSLAVLDGAIELLMPSYTFLLAVSVVNLGLVAGLAWLVPGVSGMLKVGGSALLCAGWVLYPLLGLLVDRAPGWAFQALLLGPAYLVWRLWISVLVRLRPDKIAWVRTRRREEQDGVSL